MLNKYQLTLTVTIVAFIVHNIQRFNQQSTQNNTLNLSNLIIANYFTCKRVYSEIARGIAIQVMETMVDHRQVQRTWKGFPGGLDGKEFTCNAGSLGSILETGRSCEGGNGYPLQQSCLENSMDRRAWQATVHGVAKSQIRLSD